ncbi:CBS domain-containing protein [Pontibacter sp. JAM-7]|uniref:CBS domain-containing protein n=1 Tax=Pontibacter sp. JAM-7 TaxID=3366581 RepID=UPI003AF7FC25
MLQVKDAMYPVNQPLAPNMGLVEAVDRILDAGVIGLPVVDHDHQVVGFLSEHDCLPFLVTGSYHCDSRIQVSDIMYNRPLTVSPNKSIVDLAQEMGLNRPKVYAVVEESRLVGLITRSMVMRELNSSLKHCKVVA